jgi:glycosyltransferase involved in cell wall biosynthesis
MVNLESSSLQCPTITTVTTGLWDWEEGGGLLIKPDVAELASALKQVVEWNKNERQRRGEASYILVKNKYSWNVVGIQWMNLYLSLVRGEQIYE